MPRSFSTRPRGSAKRRTAKEAADLYDWLMAEYAKVYTFDNLAYIDFYAHPGDETLSDACRQLDSVLNEVNDALCTALSDALDGPAGSALRSYIGEDKATALVGYDEQTDRQREDHRARLRADAAVQRAHHGISQL